MNEPLRQLTNLNKQIQNNNVQKPKKLPRVCKVNEVLSLGVIEMDFGDCIVGSVSERKLSITMKEAQDTPKVIWISIFNEDQLLSEMTEYIFGVRKENSFEYFDQFKFKASQRGVYNFIVGVKTPNLVDYPINFKLVVRMEGTEGALTIDLKQITRIPEVRCVKQLINQDGLRLIKLGIIKNKSRRQTKIAFKCSQNMNFTLTSELLGLDTNWTQLIDVKPKIIQVNNKGVFVLTFTTISPKNIQKDWLCVRKILVLKIKDTNIHYHFPIQITFYPQSCKQQITMQ